MADINDYSSYEKGRDQAEEQNDKTYTWCWPCLPKQFIGPTKYVSENICKIPTGSLYFASRKGPLSEASARITGSPYNIVGLIFQSKTNNKEGTYVYTVDSTLINDKTSNKIAVVNLAELIVDDSIIHHGVLPLKDFDDKLPKDSLDIQKDSKQNEYEYWYRDCTDSKDWKRRLLEKRNEILKDLFKKYRDMKPEHDAYQTLASIVGFPVAESLRSKNAFTAPELVGLILFQAGLIWDGRFAAGNKNPACCFDKRFFQKLAKNTSNKDNESDVVVALTTPRTHAAVKYSNEQVITTGDKRRDYPDIIHKKHKKKSRKPSENFEEEFHKEKIKDCKSKCNLDECNKQKEDIYFDDKKENKENNVSKSIEETDINNSNNKKHNTHVSTKGPENDEDETDRKIRYNLRKYLDDAIEYGYHCEYKDHNDNEKGSEEKEGENIYCDYYNSEDKCSYKRCYYPAKWAKNNECYHEFDELWPKPCKKCVYARTILFGSLRPVDFLVDYYCASGIDPNGHTDLKDITPLTGRRGSAGELVAIIYSLAAQRATGDMWDYDINKLNLCWFHDNLIPIELCNDTDKSCDDSIEQECKLLKGLVYKLDHDFVQKRMLHVDNFCLSGNRLLNICQRTSELAAELHALAIECDSNVKYDDKCCSLETYEDDDCGEIKFKVLVDSNDKCATEYVIVLYKYMWGKSWSYEWEKPYICNREKYYEISCRIRRLSNDLIDLKNRIPVSCIILEPVICLLEQTRNLYKYLSYCHKNYCHKKYQQRKGGELNIDEVINDVYSEDNE